MNSYLSLSKKSSSFLKEKGSKFFGYAFPIKTKEDVHSCLEEIREEHPKARHICSAFLIGLGDEEYYLINDDGEPANSAGQPILGQIRSYDLTNTYIAVVRYFGGIKLGVGGLIKAYRSTAQQAIAANEIISIIPTEIVEFKLNFELMGPVLSQLEKLNLNKQIKNHTDGISVSIDCSQEDKLHLKSLLKRFGYELGDNNSSQKL